MLLLYLYLSIGFFELLSAIFAIYIIKYQTINTSCKFYFLKFSDISLTIGTQLIKSCS